MENTNMKLTKKEAKLIADNQAATRATWAAACAHDGISPDSNFVVFSDDNPHTAEHNRLMGEFIKIRNRIAHNANRRARHEAMTSLGLNRVKGALGGVYYE
jgi:hypothetical protein